MITAFQKNAFQNNAFQISRAAVGFISTGRPQKRWWEELQEEYQERWRRERGEPTKAKPAIKIRKQAKKLADEAEQEGLLDFGGAEDVARLVIAINHARRLDEVLKYSRQLKAHIEMLREQEDEDILLLL